jgi:hypothetical protein
MTICFLIFHEDLSPDAIHLQIEADTLIKHTGLNPTFYKGFIQTACNIAISNKNFHAHFSLDNKGSIPVNLSSTYLGTLIASNVPTHIAISLAIDSRAHQAWGLFYKYQCSLASLNIALAVKSILMHHILSSSV